MTARGTDVNLIPRYRLPRRLIQGAIRDAAALIAVSAALKQALVELGAPPDKVTVLRNGVETDLFRPPADRAAARAALGLTGPTLISVGGLIERKGHHRTIEAMRQLPGYHLLIAGEGPERERLSALIERPRPDRPRPPARAPAASRNCRRCTAPPTPPSWPHRAKAGPTCCWSRWPAAPRSSPPTSGATRRSCAPRRPALIYEPNTPDGIAAAVRRLFAALPDRAATRAYAEPFSWEETTAGQLALFRRVIAERAAHPPVLHD